MRTKRAKMERDHGCGVATAEALETKAGAPTAGNPAFVVVEPSLDLAAKAVGAWGIIDYEAMARVVVRDGKTVRIEIGPFDHGLEQQYRFRVCRELGAQNVVLVADRKAGELTIMPRRVFPGYDLGDPTASLAEPDA